jgi:hypothetical protein
MNRVTIRNLALSTLLFSFACNELDDPSFDLACTGDSCPWQVDEGHLRKVSTWNEYDKAAEFVDTPTTISQQVDSELNCVLEVELFGKVEPEAALTVSIDSDDDGTIDAEATVPPLDWTSKKLKLDAGDGEKWRIVLSKSGRGRVVLGHVLADCVDDEANTDE